MIDSAPKINVEELQKAKETKLKEKEKVEKEIKLLSTARSGEVSLDNPSALDSIEALKKTYKKISNDVKLNNLVDSSKSSLSHFFDSFIESLCSILPNKEVGAEFKEEVAYSKALAATQSAVFSDSLPAIFGSILKVSTKKASYMIRDMKRDTLDLRSYIEVLTEDILFKALPENIGKYGKVQSIASKSLKALQESKQNTFDLQARVLASKGYSQHRISQVIRSYRKVMDVIPYSMHDENYLDSEELTDFILRSIAKFKRKIKYLKEQFNKMLKSKADFVKFINPGEVFNKTFSTIYKQLNANIKSAMGVKVMPPGSDLNKAYKALSDIRASMPPLISAIYQFGTTQLEKRLNNENLPETAIVDQYLAHLQESISPLLTGNILEKSFDKFEYAVKASKKLSDKLNSMKEVKASMRPTLPDNCSEIAANLKKVALKSVDDLDNTLIKMETDNSQLNLAQNKTASNFLDTVRKNAPSAYNALEEADFEKLAKVLESPTNITEAGLSANELSLWAAANASSLGLHDMNALNVIINDYLGEHRKQLKAEHDSDLRHDQKRHIDEALKYIKYKIDPIIETINRLIILGETENARLQPTGDRSKN